MAAVHLPKAIMVVNTTWVGNTFNPAHWILIPQFPPSTDFHTKISLLSPQRNSLCKTLPFLHFHNVHPLVLQTLRYKVNPPLGLRTLQRVLRRALPGRKLSCLPQWTMAATPCVPQASIPWFSEVRPMQERQPQRQETHAGGTTKGQRGAGSPARL